MQTTRWHAFPDAEALERAATARILTSAQAAIAARGAFHLVLAGGNTPRRVYAALAEAPADWPRWHIWFGDERCLPPAHPERNSRMATQTWLSLVAIPPTQIHVIPAELGAGEAARRYAAALVGRGDFDLVLLGLGEDGHTASLFPGHDWGREETAPAALAIFDAPKPPPARVSLSARRLSAAREVLFLVSGAAKRQAVAAWRAGKTIPAAAIVPDKGVDIFHDLGDL
ncbi:6-phosphogluconolactonase [Sulfuricystis multivorans]|uniref:6-phosphogluconolactonase n=1 Tax=Sulfuricystis multivorans TaxID=2211108 RepID=UPI000F81A73F|nr:6-phosphogluconolactonase [Sulfuricystis multivorans]